MFPRVLAAASALFIFASTATGAESIQNRDCLECHGDKTLTKTGADGKDVSIFVDESLVKVSVHQTNSCASCHTDLTSKHPDDNKPAQPVNCASCHAKESGEYAGSIHGVGHRTGAAAASCTDCHGTHDIRRSAERDSPVARANLANTCGRCHREAAADYNQSVHGLAAAWGKPEAATCSDCHFEHQIEQLKTAETLKISADVCSRCHASERINTKFNLPKDRVKTFFVSYHGLASQYGSTLAANCSSCHSYHLVLPSADPRSTINTNHLVATCGKCHPGATANFAAGKIHVDEESMAQGRMWAAG